MNKRPKIARTTRKRRRQIEKRRVAVVTAATSDPTAAAGAGRKLTDNEKARAAGVPKRFKQYHARYAKGGIEALIAGHLQNPALLLNHGRDRAGSIPALPTTEAADGSA